MPYIDPEIVRKAKEMDLLTYLETYEPQELVRFSGNVYRTRTHDSLKISNGKWYWWSRDIGGRSALDYLIKVRGMSFMAAVAQITGPAVNNLPVFASKPKAESPKPVFALPQMNDDTSEILRYLQGRGIDRELIRFCIDSRMLYQTRRGGYYNAVFVGYDANQVPRYATVRGTHSYFKGDVPGSDKRYSFALPNASEHLHLFESAIDLLSFATLEEIRPLNPFDGGLLSLSGVYMPKQKIEESALPPALAQYLAAHPQTAHIHLHLDNDLAGRLTTSAIMTALPKQYTAVDEPPPTGKDYNDYLCACSGLSRTNATKERDCAR
jgi:hypothetical protein